MLECAHYFKLYKEDIYIPAIRHAAILRILVAPLFYVSSIIIAEINVTLAFIFLVAPTIIYMIPGRIDKYESKHIPSDKN